MSEVPKWGIKEDGTPGNTMVSKLDMGQEHLAGLASQRYERILELERENLELSGQITFLTQRVAELEAQLAEATKPFTDDECEKHLKFTAGIEWISRGSAVDILAAHASGALNQKEPK